MGKRESICTEWKFTSLGQTSDQAVTICTTKPRLRFPLPNISGVRDARKSRHDFRRRHVSCSNARFDRRLERGELLLASGHQLRVKTNNGLVGSTAPRETFDKCYEMFAPTYRVRIDAETVSHIAAPA